jgi:hypothetical protein
VRSGHATKDWKRCLLIRREGLQPLNASDISWLERRLIDVLLEAPEIDLINRTPPPVEYVPEYKAEILERTVLAALGVLASSAHTSPSSHPRSLDPEAFPGSSLERLRAARKPPAASSGRIDDAPWAILGSLGMRLFATMARLRRAIVATHLERA